VLPNPRSLTVILHFYCFSGQHQILDRHLSIRVVLEPLLKIGMFEDVYHSGQITGFGVFRLKRLLYFSQFFDAATPQMTP
jgi:hypothetical protein